LDPDPEDVQLPRVGVPDVLVMVKVVFGDPLKVMVQVLVPDPLQLSGGALVAFARNDIDVVHE